MKRFRARSRVSRDSYPNFSKLVWMAQRSGTKGQAALAVLQDAVMVHYGEEFERAQRKAKRLAKKSGLEKVVTFTISLERAIRRYPDSRGWYRYRGFPLVAEDPKKLAGYNRRVIVVWSSETGLNVHAWAARDMYLSNAEMQVFYGAAWNQGIARPPFLAEGEWVTLRAKLIGDGYMQVVRDRYNGRSFRLTAKGMRKAQEVTAARPGQKVRR